MDNKYYCIIKDGFIDGGFFVESIHGIAKCEEVMANGGLCIDKELHQYCSSLTGKRAVNEEVLMEYIENATMRVNDGNCTHIPSYDEFVFGIDVKDCFTSVVEPSTTDNTPTMEDRVKALELALLEVL